MYQNHFQINSCVTIVLVISLYSFISISYILKMLLLILFLYTYIPLISNNHSIYEAFSNQNFLPHNLLIFLFSWFLIFLDRHQEYVTRSVLINQRTKALSPRGLFYEYRMEWIWRERLKGEEEGVDTMQGINKVLLENLLPAHVARHFLTNIKVFLSICQ